MRSRRHKATRRPVETSLASKLKNAVVWHGGTPAECASSDDGMG